MCEPEAPFSHQVRGQIGLYSHPTFPWACRRPQKEACELRQRILREADGMHPKKTHQIAMQHALMLVHYQHKRKRTQPEPVQVPNHFVGLTEATMTHSWPWVLLARMMTCPVHSERCGRRVGVVCNNSV